MWEGGSAWGTHVNQWLIHVNVWQKLLQYSSLSVIGNFQLTHKSSQTLVPKCASSAELSGGLLKNIDSGASEHEI